LIQGLRLLHQSYYSRLIKPTKPHISQGVVHYVEITVQAYIN